MSIKNNFAFFGTPDLSVIVLEKLKQNGYLPKLLITSEDKPKGRKLLLTPPPVKIWAEKEKIPYIQLKTLKKPESEEEIRKYFNERPDFFIVASYGKIIPQNILDIPRFGTLNVHPSLLPKLRGPSPIKSAILFENETGVSIMKLDAEMDHGPILAQEKIDTGSWPPYEQDLEKILAEKGGEMLSDIIEPWTMGKVEEKEQDHSKATICKKIEKSEGEIDLNSDPILNLRKIRAFYRSPGAYYLETKPDGGKKRIVIKSADLIEGKLVIKRVVPEGKKEMDYNDYIRGKR